MSLVNPITAHNFPILNISLDIGNHSCAFLRNFDVGFIFDFDYGTEFCVTFGADQDRALRGVSSAVRGAGRGY